MQTPSVIVICGPTGVGKTSVAVQAAKHFGGQIIGADSMQIYRYMDIGTAKPTPEERASVPHYLTDVIDPDEPFDAASYTRIAREIIHSLHQQNLLPFVVGGTGLYIKTLLKGVFLDGQSELRVRGHLKEMLSTHGSDWLYQRLAACDPDKAKHLHPNDTLRIIRALEVYETTGTPISEHHKTHHFSENPFRTLKIGISMDRPTLYERINRRVDSMIEAGLVDEVKRLLDKGYSMSLKSMQSIGYRHIGSFLQGNTTWEETVRTLKRDTRRYAKRQLTWFKADPEIIWVSPDDSASIFKLIAEFRP